MFILAPIPLACWLCVLLAIPGKPRHDDEVQTLVYLRLRGRQRLLVLLAVITSVIVVGIWLGGLLYRAAT